MVLKDCRWSKSKMVSTKIIFLFHFFPFSNDSCWLAKIYRNDIFHHNLSSFLDSVLRTSSFLPSPDSSIHHSAPWIALGCPVKDTLVSSFIAFPAKIKRKHLLVSSLWDPQLLQSLLPHSQRLSNFLTTAMRLFFPCSHTPECFYLSSSLLRRLNWALIVRLDRAQNFHSFFLLNLQVINMYHALSELFYFPHDQIFILSL